MIKREKTYTYRCGQKVELEKSSDEMVVRALPEHLDDSTIVGLEQVSSASTRIKTSEVKLESLMEQARTKAPTHHAYYEAGTGKEFFDGGPSLRHLYKSAFRRRGGRI